MEQDIVEVAERLGFSVVPCSACEVARDRGCANCDGVGFVWKSHGATISSSGLVRFAERRQQTPWF